MLLTVAQQIPSLPFGVQYGALGALALAFLYTLHWMMRSGTAALEKIVAKQENQSASINTLAATIVSLQKQLLAHDLTVTGLNPSTGVDIDERVQKALTKYKELQRTLDETIRVIQSRGVAMNPLHA